MFDSNITLALSGGNQRYGETSCSFVDNKNMGTLGLLKEDKISIPVFSECNQGRHAAFYVNHRALLYKLHLFSKNPLVMSVSREVTCGSLND